MAKQEELQPSRLRQEGAGIFFGYGRVLANEMQAVPFSRSERGSGYEEAPEFKKGKLELPPSAVRRKEKEREKRKEQMKAEKKERKRIKAEAEKVYFSEEEEPVPVEDDKASPEKAKEADGPGRAESARAVTARTSIIGIVAVIELGKIPTSTLGSRRRSGSPRI